MLFTQLLGEGTIGSLHLVSPRMLSLVPFACASFNLFPFTLINYNPKYNSLAKFYASS